ncbi:hypothetical protein TYRP_016988 [Tyrophagus putrescentiae]|nr:hypothetical protein TYRP_016988 [Tyrophagus putrescentiae]
MILNSRRVSLSQQLQNWLKLCPLAAILAVIAAAVLALGCRGEHSCCGGSTAQPRAAKSDVTWLFSTTRVSQAQRAGPEEEGVDNVQVTPG